jgi:hypothetical protein
MFLRRIEEEEEEEEEEEIDGYQLSSSYGMVGTCTRS